MGAHSVHNLPHCFSSAHPCRPAGTWMCAVASIGHRHSTAPRARNAAWFRRSRVLPYTPAAPPQAPHAGLAARRAGPLPPAVVSPTGRTTQQRPCRALLAATPWSTPQCAILTGSPSVAGPTGRTETRRPRGGARALPDHHSRGSPAVRGAGGRDDDRRSPGLAVGRIRHAHALLARRLSQVGAASCRTRSRAGHRTGWPPWHRGPAAARLRASCSPHHGRCTQR